MEKKKKTRENKKGSGIYYKGSERKIEYLGMYRLTQNYRTYRLSLQHELYLNESTHFFFFCIRRQHERDLKDKSYFLKNIFLFFFYHYI